MTDLSDQIREALAKATPGPWRSDGDASPDDVSIYGPADEWLANIGNWSRSNPDAPEEMQREQLIEMRDVADAALIVLLRNNIDALLAVAEAARRLDAAGMTWHASPSLIELRETLAALDAAAGKEGT